MNVVRIRIKGMHNVVDKTYDLNNFNLIVGNNGAGKSTILEAIQLGLLGYIPRQGKTNEAIMKHANCDSMSVTVTTDTGVVISRTWTRHGNKVSSNVVTNDESFTVDELSLPIYDFDKFSSMSANAQKDVILSMLPKDDTKITYSDVLHIPDDKSSPWLTDFIKSVPEEVTIENCKAINAQLKSKLSELRGSLDRTVSTIQTLAHYSDVPDTSVDALEAELAQLQAEKMESTRVRENNMRRNSILAQLDLFTNMSDCVDTDEQLRQYEVQSEQLYESFTVNTERLKLMRDELDKIMMKIKDLQHIIEGRCPLSDGSCPKLHDASIAANEQIHELYAKYDEQMHAIDDLNKQLDDDSHHRGMIRNMVEGLRDRYRRRDALLSQLKEIPECTIMDDEVIDSQISECIDTIAKVKANERYFSLITDLNNDRFNTENAISVVKDWIDITGPNKLQSRICIDAMDSLSDSISSYISKCLPDCGALIAGSDKNNSFSYGLVKNDAFIDYDTMSSGERCIFTMCFILALSKLRNHEMPVIVDDIFDHLDNDNISYLLESLYNMQEGPQVIIATAKDISFADIEQIEP